MTYGWVVSLSNESLVFMHGKIFSEETALKIDRKWKSRSAFREVKHSIIQGTSVVYGGQCVGQ